MQLARGHFLQMTFNQTEWLHEPVLDQMVTEPPHDRILLSMYIDMLRHCRVRHAGQEIYAKGMTGRNLDPEFKQLDGRQAVQLTP